MKIAAALFAALLLVACNPEDAPLASAAPPAEPAVEGLPGPEGSPENQAFLRAKNMELCDNWGALARTTMDARQAGVPMRKLIDGMNPGDQSETMTRMIVLAYDSPRYHTDEHQQREITEFENKVYAACLRENNLP